MRWDLPIGARHALAVTFDHVRTDQPVEVFTARQRVDEGSIEFRAALPPHVPPASATGDLRLGLEASRVGGTVLFGAVPVLNTRQDVVQVFAGLAGVLVGARSELVGDVSAHLGRALIGGPEHPASPGPIYAYIEGHFAGTLRMPNQLALSSQLSVQMTAAALPQVQQVAIGGPALVRGYLLDDGAFDRAVILRTMLTKSYRPQLLSARGGPSAFTLSALADVGVGSRVGGWTMPAVSLGLAAAYRLGRAAQVSADEACALIDRAVTQAGDCRLTIRLTLAYG